MISDKDSLSGVKLNALFANINAALKHTGSVWKYSWQSPYRDSADRFDKFFTEKLNDYARNLNGKQSVIAHMSVAQVVKPHATNKYILQLDLKQYYESINFSSVKKHFEKADFHPEFIEHIKLFYFGETGFLRRGLRGSAIISELIGVKIDNIVGRLLHENGHINVAYTRFYDDMLFSSDEREPLKNIEESLPSLLEPLDLTINDKKSKLKIVDNSLLLGLRIYQSKIVVPKKFKRLVRAREHALTKYYNSTNWSDIDNVRELKRFTGHVIGSLWYIVNSSEDDTSMYAERIEEYKDILGECDSAVNEIKSDEDILYDYHS